MKVVSNRNWGFWFHVLAALLWFVQMVAVGILMWPLDWKWYLVEISLWANLASHWAGASAERPTEIKE